MDVVNLFIGAAAMIVSGMWFNDKTLISGGAVLLWIGVASH